MVGEGGGGSGEGARERGDSVTEELVQWNKVKGLEKSKLNLLLDDRSRVKAQIDALEESLSNLNNKILTALATADVKTVAVGETRVTLVQGGTSEKLDKKRLWTRLLELGVKEKTVVKAYADATEVVERAPSIRVTEPKEGKE